MTAAALVLLLPLAQGTTSPLTTGTRVRVTVRESGQAQRQLVGSLRTFDSETLTLSAQDSASHVALPRPTITRIEVSRGRKGHTVHGLLLGAVLGLAVVALKDAGCEPDCDTSDSETGFIAAAIGGGALVGAGVGTLIRSERWESQPWAVGPRRASGAPPPISGTGLRISLRF